MSTAALAKWWAGLLKMAKFRLYLPFVPIKYADIPMNTRVSSYLKRSIKRTAVTLLVAALGYSTVPIAIAADVKPPLMLANVYTPSVALADYWVSEKYDGVRGFWDGQKLLTRGGQTINVPAWFTANWPATLMDGELWAGRGQFQQAVSTVRQQTPDDAAWRGIKFMVFDLPAEPGVFTDRLTKLNNVVAKLAVPWVQAVPQTKATTHAALQSQLKQITKAGAAPGAEGLMLHRGSSLYKGGAQRRFTESQNPRRCRSQSHWLHSWQGQVRRPNGRAAG